MCHHRRRGRRKLYPRADCTQSLDRHCVLYTTNVRVSTVAVSTIDRSTSWALFSSPGRSTMASSNDTVGAYRVHMGRKPTANRQGAPYTTKPCVDAASLSTMDRSTSREVVSSPDRFVMWLPKWTGDEATSHEVDRYIVNPAKVSAHALVVYKTRSMFTQVLLVGHAPAASRGEAKWNDPEGRIIAACITFR